MGLADVRNGANDTVSFDDSVLLDCTTLHSMWMRVVGGSTKI